MVESAATWVVFTDTGNEFSRPVTAYVIDKDYLIGQS
jgi:hypothetical protein